MGKNRKYLSGKQIKSLLQDKAGGLAPTLIQAKFDISKSAYYRIIQDGAQILLPTQKKVQQAKYNIINEQVQEQFDKLRDIGYPISGPMIQLFAVNAARKLMDCPSISDEDKDLYSKATFGNSWLRNFKETSGLRKLRVNGERASVPSGVWQLMAPLIEEIEHLDIPISRIYNWDETGLCYRAMPKYTLAGFGDDGAGTKEDRKRITALVCANGDGSDNSVVLIGKSKKPHKTSQKFWQDLGVQYFSNETAWMTSSIFNELLIEFDNNCDSTTVLLLDNFSGHKLLTDTILNHVVCIYLPPNTTSVTQALDAGIISAFKINFRTKLMDFICTRVLEITPKFDMKEISIFRIAPWIKESIDMLKPLSIQKCFYKTLKMQSLKPNEVDLPTVENSLNILASSMSALYQREVRVEEALLFVEGDWEEGIMEQGQTINGKESDNIVIPDTSVMLNYLRRLRTYCSDTGLETGVASLNELELLLNGHMNFE